MAQLTGLTAAHFEIVGEVSQKEHYGLWGEINYAKLTLDHAEDLVNRGFPHLRKKDLPKVKSKSEEEK